MRRFIASLPGKVVAQLAVLSLVLPSFTLITSSRAEAQLQSQPTWAVVPFVNKTDMKDLGNVAAEAVGSEFAKTNKYDVVPQEQMNRTIEQLGLTPPVTQQVSLMRLAQEVKASTIVTGTVEGYRVVKDGTGKRADVVITTQIVDVVSGVSINGSALGGSSTVRPGDVADDTLVNEAISTVAAMSVQQVEAKTLPTATVLNTLTDSALINQGTRSGFERGQNVIVLRGREQVASAVVIDVDPDSATIKITRPIKGMQPGDKVRAIFTPPTIPNIGSLWKQSKDHAPDVPKQHPKSNNDGLFQAVALLVVASVLFGGGHAGNNNVFPSVQAEATLFPDPALGAPAVKVSWRTDLFVKGKSTKFQFQIWRSDITTSPVEVADPSATSKVDDQNVRSVSYGQFSQVGGTTCIALPTANATGVPGITPGQPYIYQVELVYSLALIDLPSGGSNGGGGGGGTNNGGTNGTNNGGTNGTNNGGTNGTNNGGTNATNNGGTNGTNNGGTNGTNTGTTGSTNQQCFFVTERASAKGLATPLTPPGLESPSADLPISVLPGSSTQPFTFDPVATTSFSLEVQYVLEFSTKSNFPKGKTQIFGTTLSSATSGQLSFGLIDTVGDLASFLRSQGEVWWRVGARNLNDNPGPVPDKNGQRYIFSNPRKFTRFGTPPPPPA